MVVISAASRRSAGYHLQKKIG